MLDKFAELKNHEGCGGHEPGHKCCGRHKKHVEENHNHHAHGGCCGTHNHDTPQAEGLTEEEQQVISAIEECGCIPVVRFVMKSSKSSHFASTALSAVYITSLEDDIEDVKARSKILAALEHRGLLSIDYDIPVSNYSYDEYLNSKIFKDFTAMMEESAEKEGFVFDIADMDKGSIALI